MEKSKFYVYRISNYSGRKEYRRTKCLERWSIDKSSCWKFSRQGAKNIVERETLFDKARFYTFGFEPVD